LVFEVKSVRTLFAMRNLSAARGRLVVSIFGVAFASFLMAAQGGLLFGFTLAASRIVDALDADLWIVPKGIPAFDFVSILPSRYADLALAAPGVIATGLGVAGWTPFAKPNGDRMFVLVVGVEHGFLGRLPDLPKIGGRAGIAQAAISVDLTDASRLGVADHNPLAPEINLHRAQVVTVLQGFASFLGTPFVFAAYPDARTYVGVPAERAGFILVRVAQNANPVPARDWLRTRLPDADTWTKVEFSSRSRLFWLIQTGAGGALSLAAMLGFAIGMVIVAQTIYGLTAESVEEYATLRAMGATEDYVRAVVRTQALACGAVGGTIGLLMVKPFEALARGLVTWIDVPPWMFGVVALALCLMCLGAARIGVRPALAADPGRVFRA
jgi:putative ABC transport system permease protein